MLTDLYRVLPVPPARIAREWPTISRFILPAIKDETSELEMFGKLLSGHSQLVQIDSNAAHAYLVLRVQEMEGVLCCYIGYLGGKFSGGPKAFATFVRNVTATIERKAKDIGCKEVRVGGRDWSRVLTDYDAFDGMNNGLRKAI